MWRQRRHPTHLPALTSVDQVEPCWWQGPGEEGVRDGVTDHLHLHKKLITSSALIEPVLPQAGQLGMHFGDSFSHHKCRPG